MSNHLNRHCERSEAIQGRQSSTPPWIASSQSLLAMTNSEET
jgi:hypothetical protein